MSIKTRLRLSERDALVLRELGDLLSELAARDLAERVFLGDEHTGADFARRKRQLTAYTTSRWAGTIVRGSNDQWELARRAQAAHLAVLSSAIETISGRLAVPIGACDVATRIEGYHSQRERAAKQHRLQGLRGRAARVSAERAAGHVRVVRGGKGLLHLRLHLDDAGLGPDQWRQRWAEARWRIEADGESGKTHGNQSIQIGPDGTVLIKLPTELAARHAEHVDRHGRYRLEATAAFAYREEAWRAQIGAHRAVGYTIRFEDRRCYLSAAFTLPQPVLPEGVDDDSLMKAALAGGVVGIDHNADHLAAWRLDAHGNPVGRPDRIDIDCTGPASRRDAQIRHACSTLIRTARRSGATALVIEDLGFATGREACGWSGRGGRRFRGLVAGMPTARFMTRLIAMAHRANLAVILIDPAYTSRWGAKYWQKTTHTSTRKTSRHDAAAIVIGRRGQGLGARRRAEKTVSRMKTEAAPPRTRTRARGGAGTEDHRPARVSTPARPSHAPRSRARPEERAHDAPRQRTRTTPQPAQNRSGQTTDQRSWIQDSLELSV